VIDADAARHLRDLSDVARGDATSASRAAIFTWGVTLLTAYVWGDMDDQTYIDQTEDLMNAVALLSDDERAI
jgi:hypothetical protein